MFAQGADLEEYTSAVLAYLHFCTETVMTTKTIKVFPNQKPWLDRNMRLLLGDAAFRSGDKPAYKSARRDLKKGIREAKRRYKQRIESHFENNDPRSMWRGIKTLTDYKSSTTQISQDSDLPDTLNRFFARFDKQHSRATADKTEPQEEEQTLFLQHHQVRSTLRRIDVTKAAGLDMCQPAS